MIWAEKQGIALRHVQHGKPQQHAYVERYKRTARHEWLGAYIFDITQKLHDIATNQLWIYNHDRSKMGIGGITPPQKLKITA